MSKIADMDEDKSVTNDSEDDNSETGSVSDSDGSYAEGEGDDEIVAVKPAIKISEEDIDIDVNESDIDESENDDSEFGDMDNKSNPDSDDEKTENLPLKRSDGLQNNFIEDDVSDSESEADEHYLQKFDEKIKKNIIEEFHPELQIHNNEEIEALSRVVRNEFGVIIDPLHKTLPFLTKYEKARILGERAKQLNSGAMSFIKVDISVIDGYLIALQELEQKCIPFIIKRPLPNGGCEYWKLKDLEFLA